MIYWYIKKFCSGTLNLAETHIGPRYMKIPFTVVQAEALNAYVCFQTRKHSLQAQPFVWCMFLFEVFYTLLDVNSGAPRARVDVAP